jgi:hypothetical protein
MIFKNKENIMSRLCVSWKKIHEIEIAFICCRDFINKTGLTYRNCNHKQEDY